MPASQPNSGETENYGVKRSGEVLGHRDWTPRGRQVLKLVFNVGALYLKYIWSKNKVYIHINPIQYGLF